MNGSAAGLPRNPYPSEPPRLDMENVPPPNYAAALDWMQVLEGRAVSFDIWARGNYMRRLITHERTKSSPLVVPFRRVEQMRWAYRRLALLGLAVDFIYTGGVSKPKRCLTLRPNDGPCARLDGGWGYIAELGSFATVRGRECFALSGWSQLMPEPILDWVVDEASEAFARGDVFVAPAEHVGIDLSRWQPGAAALADVAGGKLVRHGRAATALMQLELPILEAMPSNAFQRFLTESADELARFRVCFRRLVDETEPDDLEDVVEEIRAEVAAMSQSRRYASMRRSIQLLGGTLAVGTSAAVAVVAKAPELALPVAASAGAAAATNALVDLWKQKAEGQAKLRDNSFSLLWQLGIDAVGKVRTSSQPARLGTLQRIEPDAGGALPECHWLCPPTCGLAILAIRK